MTTDHKLPSATELLKTLRGQTITSEEHLAQKLIKADRAALRNAVLGTVATMFPVRTGGVSDCDPYDAGYDAAIGDVFKRLTYLFDDVK